MDSRVFLPLHVQIPVGTRPVTAMHAVLGAGSAFGAVTSRRVYAKHSNIGEGMVATFRKCGFTVELQRDKVEEVRTCALRWPRCFMYHHLSFGSLC